MSQPKIQKTYTLAKLQNKNTIVGYYALPLRFRKVNRSQWNKIDKLMSIHELGVAYCETQAEVRMIMSNHYPDYSEA